MDDRLRAALCVALLAACSPSESPREVSRWLHAERCPCASGATLVLNEHGKAIAAACDYSESGDRWTAPRGSHGCCDYTYDLMAGEWFIILRSADLDCEQLDA